MILRPKQTAGKFKLSAGTLRNYEAKGLVPPAGRSANGYRVYAEEHEAYLACIQAMAPAFGMEVTTEVLQCLQRGEWDKALWTVREKEILLVEDKKRLEALTKRLELHAGGRLAYDIENRLTIHEVSKRTGAPKSAVRYWENDGFFTAGRNPANDYRLYSEAHLLTITLIQVLQGCVYSEDTAALKQSIRAMDHQNADEVLKLAGQLSRYLNQTLRAQMRALGALYQLIELTAPDK